MQYSDRVTLIRRAGRKGPDGKPVLDAIGNQVFDEETTEVWADIVSPSRAEVTAAGTRGLVPSATVKVHADDYSGQTVVAVAGQRLTVYRTYRPGPDDVELYVTEKAGDADGH